MKIFTFFVFFNFSKLFCQFLDVLPSSFIEKLILVNKKDLFFTDLNSGVNLNKIIINSQLDSTFLFSSFLFNENIDISHNDHVSKKVWLFHLKDSNFGLYINPLLSISSTNSISNLYNRNSRGLELRLNLFKKISLHSEFIENQVFLTNDNIKKIDTFNVISGVGFYKNFKKNGIDYFSTNARICGNLFTVKNSFIHFTFGHFQQKFGIGIHSLISNGTYKPALGLRFLTKLGNKVTYTNYWSKMQGFTPILGNTIFPEKYLSIHRFGIKFLKYNNLEVGLSEMNIHSRNNGLGGFDLEYLNPIVFYRFVESNLGSGDNSLIAIDLTFSKKNFSIYTQFVLDEFRKKDFNKKWWGNKFAYQVGIRHIKKINSKYGHLLQIESNTVRPYTYSHYSTLNSYTHFNQPIGHIAGSNFRDFSLNYCGFFKYGIWVDFKFNYLIKGEDSFINGKSMGGNLNISSDKRFSDYNVILMQGVKTKVYTISLSLNKQIWHRFNIGVEVGTLKQKYRSNFNTYFLGRFSYRLENFSPFL